MANAGLMAKSARDFVDDLRSAWTTQRNGETAGLSHSAHAPSGLRRLSVPRIHGEVQKSMDRMMFRHGLVGSRFANGEPQAAFAA